MVTTRSQTRSGGNTAGAPKDERNNPTAAKPRRRAGEATRKPKTARRKPREPISRLAEKPSPSPPTPTQDPSSSAIHHLLPTQYGLIQERIAHLGPYALVVQAILWNQTTGRTALPILALFLALYPTPESLASASLAALTKLIKPLGLHNVRAKRLIALGRTWVEAPVCKERRYRRLGYPVRGAGADVKPGEVLGEEDQRVGWEVAHLPGVGAYAIDSFRIFGRDAVRGVVVAAGCSGDGDDDGAEWRKVVPGDKELRLYLRWRWAGEGWDWDPLSGKRVRAMMDVGGRAGVARRVVELSG